MILRPDYNLKNIFSIDLDKLQQEGIRVILFDLDSTLVQSKTGAYRQEVKNWLDEVKQKFTIAIISNNKSIDYIQKVQNQSDFEVIGYAGKPSTKKIRAYLEKIQATPQETVMVGDRPLTDILAGKKAGTKTILVDSISADIEPPLTRFVRKLERLVIRK